jgi:hypothetical protein
MNKGTLKLLLCAAFFRIINFTLKQYYFFRVLYESLNMILQNSLNRHHSDSLGRIVKTNTTSRLIYII